MNLSSFKINDLKTYLKCKFLNHTKINEDTKLKNNNIKVKLKLKIFY